MKLSTYAPANLLGSSYSGTHADTSSAAAPSAMSRLLARWRAAREARAARAALAQLDDRLLRDLGVAQDEIPRLRAGEAFTPRAWQH